MDKGRCTERIRYIVFISKKVNEARGKEKTLQVDAGQNGRHFLFDWTALVNAPSVSDYIPHDGRHSHMTVRSCVCVRALSLYFSFPRAVCYF